MNLNITTNLQVGCLQDFWTCPFRVPPSFLQFARLPPKIVLKKGFIPSSVALVMWGIGIQSFLFLLLEVAEWNETKLPVGVVVVVDVTCEFVTSEVVTSDMIETGC